MTAFLGCDAGPEFVISPASHPEQKIPEGSREVPTGHLRVWGTVVPMPEGSVTVITIGSHMKPDPSGIFSSCS